MWYLSNMKTKSKKYNKQNNKKIKESQYAKNDG